MTTPLTGLELRMIERMGELPTSRLAAPIGSRVSEFEGDDITDAGRRQIAAHESWCRRRPATVRLSFMKLAAFAFPANPFSLAWVPEAPPMKKIEWMPAVRRAMAHV